MITISLANVLILNNNELTPWTDLDMVAVPDTLTYNNNANLPRAILADTSMNKFISTMNKMTSSLPFKYDYAVGVTK